MASVNTALYPEGTKWSSTIVLVTSNSLKNVHGTSTYGEEKRNEENKA
jgi:hypothetical protein